MQVLVVPGDVTVPADCENVVQMTVKHFGKIDILTQGNLPYSTTKVAMQHLIRCAALGECSARGATNAPGNIVPGFIRTLMAKPPGVDPDDFLKTSDPSVEPLINTIISVLRKVHDGVRISKPIPCRPESWTRTRVKHHAVVVLASLMADGYALKLQSFIDVLSRVVNVIVVPGDVTVEKDVENVVQKTVNHFGRIDILVNNAGISRPGTVEGTSVEDFKMVWDINFNGPLCMMKNAMPYLRQTKGNVVNISSISSMKSHNLIAPYSTSKAALNHLTQCAALENAPYGVRVNGICPCFIKTLISKPPHVSEEDHYKNFERLAAGTQAIKRVGSPEEVGRCVAFLASDDAAFITGISMPMDGGHLLLSPISGPNPSAEARAQNK
ncbi:hypothetical protein HPB50_021474 [Hyalomma asiaticum]|uniref:Uncharacterized protein n=1 Tax=Hyalomma asiaticum TaxID=266040 RepID=A0ACB7SG55_HYAAI|nr:hypothetical protein HPB50_021474 [Hyalomma asiaticum]